MIKIDNIKKGHYFKLNESYPVYGEMWDKQGEYETDEVIGHTKPSDIAVVTYITQEFKDEYIPIAKIGEVKGGFGYKDETLTFGFSNKIPNGYYIEFKVLTGEYAGYDGLALNEDDMKVASFIPRFVEKQKCV